MHTPGWAPLLCGHITPVDEEVNKNIMKVARMAPARCAGVALRFCKRFQGRGFPRRERASLTPVRHARCAIRAADNGGQREAGRAADLVRTPPSAFAK